MYWTDRSRAAVTERRSAGPGYTEAATRVGSGRSARSADAIERPELPPRRAKRAFSARRTDLGRSVTPRVVSPAPPSSWGNPNFGYATSGEGSGGGRAGAMAGPPGPVKRQGPITSRMGPNLVPRWFPVGGSFRAVSAVNLA